MTESEIRSQIALAIAELRADMAAMRADKPTVTDGHSDGKRVRYVRHETRVTVLTEVLNMLGDR